MVSPEDEAAEIPVSAVLLYRSIKRFRVGDILGQSTVLNYDKRNAKALPRVYDAVADGIRRRLDLGQQLLLTALDHLVEDRVHKFRVIAGHLIQPVHSVEVYPA